MEIFELRYFLGVAAHQNIHRASENLNVSPASLSKAITRLEGQLAVKLFSRDGRNIKLTEHGRLLQKRASEIVQLEESATLELSGHLGTIQASIAGPEILLSEMGIELSRQILQKYPLARFDFKACDDKAALDLVAAGEAHFALITDDEFLTSEFSAKTVGQTTFQTFVGVGHPLYASAKSKKQVAIELLLKHSFVSPSHALLGKVGAKQSLDGWRDDKFPRHVAFRTSSLKILEQILTEGDALAYLPDYFAQKLKVEAINVIGCPYTCQQKIKLVTRNSNSIGWLNQIF